MHYIEGQSRTQLQLFNSIDDSIDEDNPVRFMDAFIEGIYRTSPEKLSYKGKSNVGRKSYHPCTLLKLYLYGYLNRISSSRRLETETYRNIEVKWLLCDLHPDFKTIADFRKDNKESIRFVTLSFRKFLQEEGYIEGNTLTYDGSKVKACSSKEKVLTLDRITRRMLKIEQQLESYLSELSTNDKAERTEDEMAIFLSQNDINKAMMEEIETLRAQLEELEGFKKQIQESEFSSYCPTDPGAHLMKSRDGFIPAYNVQTGVDSKNKMIVLAEVIQEGNDLTSIANNCKQTQEQLGITPAIVLADAGYGHLSQIEAIESSGETTCIIPITDCPSKIKEKQHGIKFTYEKESDSYICSKGKRLKAKKNGRTQHGKTYDIYQAKKADCTHCPLFGKCTTSKNGRMLKIPQNQSFREQYTKRLETSRSKELIKERKSQIEHVFGTLKRWMGKVPLLLTSQDKVQTEIDIYTTAYNLRRLLNIERMPLLLAKVANYFSAREESVIMSYFLVLFCLSPAFIGRIGRV